MSGVEHPRVCSGCGLSEPAVEFATYYAGRRCRRCRAAVVRAWHVANKERTKARRAEYQRLPARREANKSYKRKHRYGLTSEDFTSMLEKQEGRCLICSESPRLVVDHDHKTGRVRGLLCDKCNRMLGAASDSPDRLLAGAKYLGGLA